MGLAQGLKKAHGGAHLFWNLYNDEMEQYLLTYYLCVPGKEGIKLKLLLIKESLRAKLYFFCHHSV